MSEDNNKPGRGTRFEAWVGKQKQKSSFRDWLRAYKNNYDNQDLHQYQRKTPVFTTPDASIDPITAYRYDRLTGRDQTRFESYHKELSMLGYDLYSFTGIDKFWRLSPVERDRLYYVVQDPDKFKQKVKDDYFGNFKTQFTDFQERFTEFFEDFKEAQPSFDPEAIVDHYRFMGLERTADKKFIRDRYKMLAFKFHPDHGGDTEKMKGLNIAFASIMRHIKS